MVYGETLMICRLTLAPGAISAAHDHVHEQMTIVERGRVRFVLGHGVAERSEASGERTIVGWTSVHPDRGRNDECRNQNDETPATQFTLSPGGRGPG